MLDPDLASPEVIADPHPHLRRLRESDPVHRSPRGFWLVTRYADVAHGLRRPELGTGRTPEQLRALYGSGPAFAFASRRFQYFDPPDHTRVRSLVAKAFTLRRVEAMRPRMQPVVDRLLDRAAARCEVELIEEVAHQLPAIVICEMLGVPEDDQPLMSRWASTIPFIIAPVVEPARLAEADAAIGQLFAYLGRLIDGRRKRPGDDLLTALMAAEEAGNRLSPEELVATAVFLFSAGHHTTRNLVGNGVLALMHNRAAWERLVAEPALVPSAIEECLRYEPSIVFAPRRAKVDVTIGDRRIPAGDLVYLSLAGANRDPARFAEPDRFDIARRENEHLAFGGGIHHCLGASLARAEAQLLLASLVGRFPCMELRQQTISWRPTMTYRGLEALWLVLDARTGSGGVAPVE
jgi:hypothetical protein